MRLYLGGRAETALGEKDFSNYNTTKEQALESQFDSLPEQDFKGEALSRVFSRVTLTGSGKSEMAGHLEKHRSVPLQGASSGGTDAKCPQPLDRGLWNGFGNKARGMKKRKMGRQVSKCLLCKHQEPSSVPSSHVQGECCTG